METLKCEMQFINKIGFKRQMVRYRDAAQIQVFVIRPVLAIQYAEFADSYLGLQTAKSDILNVWKTCNRNYNLKSN